MANRRIIGRSGPVVRTPEGRADWCAQRTAGDAAADARADGVPAAAMVAGYATLDDPQLRARHFFEPVTHPLVGEQEYPTWPVRMSAGPDRYWTGPAPMLGEHTAAVLREELAIDDATLARLLAENVIGTTPVAR